MVSEMDILESFENDNKWLNLNFEEIQKTYPNKFVAIKKSKIIDSDRKSKELINRLDKKGLSVARTVIEFIPERGTLVLF